MKEAHIEWQAVVYGNLCFCVLAGVERPGPDRATDGLVKMKKTGGK